MMLSENELKSLVLKKGGFSEEENLRILKRFINRTNTLEYFFKKYNLYNKKALEIGSSYGQDLIHFSKDSIGIEFEEKMVKFSKNLGCNVIQLNIENTELPFEEKSFDIFYGADILIHMVSPFKLLLEARYLLKDDGILLLQFPSSSPFFKKDHTVLHFYTFNHRTIKMTIENAGFEILEITSRVRRKGNFINKIFYPLLTRYGNHLWIVAKKAEMKVDHTRSQKPDWVRSRIWLQK